MFTNMTNSTVQQTNSGGRNGCTSNEYAGMVVSFVNEVVELAHLFGADTARVFAKLDKYLAAVGDWVGVARAFLKRGVFGFHGFGGDGSDCHSVATEELKSSDKVLSKFEVKFSIPRKPIWATEFICKVLKVDF